MAQDLGVSRNTVTATLDELIADGWVEARRGSGVYVLHETRAEQPEAVDAPTDEPFTRPFEIDPPGLDIFPLEAWRRIQARRWADMPRMDLREGASAGYSGLRRTIADHVWVAHGVSCTPEQIIVTQGARSGLDLVLRCLTEPGDDVWLEKPGYFGFRSIMDAAGRRPVYAPVDAEGLDVAAARALSPGARLAVVTPQSQMPTCMRMSEERRQALLDWAAETGGWIFEDDYDAEFRFDKGRALPLAGQPGADRVIYAHSFNKTLFPALRIGFLVVPPGLTDLFVEKRRHADGYPSVPDQMVLRDFIEAGWLDTHVRACRAAYRQRKDVMYETVEPMLRRWLRFEDHPSGLHIVAWLDPAVSPAALRDRALSVGIHLTPMDDYYPEPAGDPRLVLGFAGFTPDRLIAGARKLLAILSEETTG
jgi:GntR family transcriptional regulator/MocR family aminotransferase